MPRQATHHVHDRTYHVVQHGGRWWVEREDGQGEHASPSVDDAITWAIHTAERDHAQGLDVIVCVEQDGSWHTAWHSPRTRPS